MKTSSRRRVLISSVAMLLVAMLALGTATFAWFTNNKTVTADGMKVTSSAAKGLQITGKNGVKGNLQDTNWGPKYTFTTEAMIQPVSVNYTEDGEYNKITAGSYPADVKVTGAWKSGDTTNYTGWATTDSFPTVAAAAGTEAVGSNDFYVAYEVGVRSTGDDIANVKLQVNIADAVTNNKASEYMRVAILDQTDRATQSYTSDAIEMVVGKEDSPNAITELSNAMPTGVTAQKLVAGGADNEVNIGTVTQTPQYYTILVWFEGQDAECVDDYTNAAGKIDVKFYYT